MNNILLQIARLPSLLVALTVVGVILLIWALFLLIRNARRAILPAVPGVLIIGLVALVAVKHPFIFGSENLENLAGLDLKLDPPLSDDWPQWRGPNRDGIGRAPGLRLDWVRNPPEMLWKVPLGGGYSSFAIVGDSAYTQDYEPGKEGVVCFDAGNGRTRWRYTYPVSYDNFRAGYAKGPRATPAVHDGRVYTVGATGKFLCLEAAPADGQAKLLWQHDLLAEFAAPLPTWGVACSPLIEGDLVIVQPGGEKGTIAAFNRRSGDLAWTALGEATGYSSPVAATLAGVRQIVALTGTHLVGLSPEDGKQLWSFDFPTNLNANIATPLIVEDAIFVSAAYGTGCALVVIGPGEGGRLVAKTAFRRKIMRTHHMTCVLRDGHVYGCDDFRGDLICLDLRHPKDAVWETQRTGKGSLILAEGHLIEMSESGVLELIEATPDGFHLKGKVPDVLAGPDSWAHPALARGRLYLRDHEKAICFKVVQ